MPLIQSTKKDRSFIDGPGRLDNGRDGGRHDGGRRREGGTDVRVSMEQRERHEILHTEPHSSINDYSKTYSLNTHGKPLCNLNDMQPKSSLEHRNEEQQLVDGNISRLRSNKVIYSNLNDKFGRSKSKLTQGFSQTLSNSKRISIELYGERN